ncbi:unnamed protein product, partial [Trichogramma brassicae]
MSTVSGNSLVRAALSSSTFCEVVPPASKAVRYLTGIFAPSAAAATVSNHIFRHFLHVLYPSRHWISFILTGE